MTTNAPRLVTAALALAPLAAQGGILWADATVQPTLHVREYANGDYGLCFSGWSTSANNPLLGNEEAAAVGTESGARTVTSTSSDFLRDGTGGAADNVLFPFVPDSRVASIFRPTAPNHDWFGFLAPTSAPVPDRDIGSLCFRIRLAQPLPWSVLQPILANSRAGVALADSNANRTGTRFVVTPQRAVNAEICAYEFDRGAGATTINYAGIDGGAPGNATLTSPAGSPWTAGRTGSALRAGATCDTGWHGDLGGRLTVAWVMRQGAPLAGVSSLVTLDGWRIFTGGTAGTGLRCIGWGGTPAALDLGVNVQAMAANNWVHIALVIDRDAGFARWAVNGNPAGTIPLSGTLSIQASPNTLLLGAAGGAGCDYHLDEFRLQTGAADAATVTGWAAASPAMAMPYSATCGASLRTTGVPSVGNASFALRIEAPPAAAVLVTLGFGSTLLNLPLPLDLVFLDPNLGGCLWYSDLTGQLPVQAIPGSGLLVAPLPIPPNAALRGLELHAQALVVDNGQRLATNALALSIE